MKTRQLWVCDCCSQSYRSPVVLRVAPKHHCPSLKASKVRPFVLQPTPVEVKP